MLNDKAAFCLTYGLMIILFFTGREQGE
jgi:hypothetical protein